MKKAAILSIAAFYLLLTTGMYVCVLHCTAEYFVSPKIAMHDNCDKAREGKEHKACKDKDGCDCCKKHGSYVLKENINPAAAFQALQFAVTIHHAIILNIIQEHPATVTLAWQESNAPPWKSGKAISIQFHSLQI
jgi:ABC-type nickel/cobalt efflux system permease component RcnA